MSSGGQPTEATKEYIEFKHGLKMAFEEKVHENMLNEIATAAKAGLKNFVGRR